jgi:CDP-paratose 2-epimerase
MKILITGGAGFVGSTLSLNFKNKYPKYEIFALDNLRRRGSELNLSRLKEAGVQFFHGDIRNKEDLDVFESIDMIIDASADPSVLSGINSPVFPVINTNLSGTVNCLELADKHKAGFVFISTSRVYPIKNLESLHYEELETRFQWKNEQTLPGVSSKGISENFPLSGSRSFYGTTKLASELLITEYNALKNMPTVINRCGVISGPWQMGKVDQGVLVLWLARHFFKGELSYIGYGGTGKQTRDVMHPDDLFALIDHQVHNMNMYNGETFNVGGGVPISFSLQELTKICQEVTGNIIKINSSIENREADIRIYISDFEKLHNLSGWAPQKDLRLLVSETFDWLQKNEKKLKQILN